MCTGGTTTSCIALDFSRRRTSPEKILSSTTAWQIFPEKNNQKACRSAKRVSKTTPGSSSKQKVEEVIRYKLVPLLPTTACMQLKQPHQPHINRHQAQLHGIEAINGGHNRGNQARHHGGATTHGDKRNGEPAEDKDSVRGATLSNNLYSMQGATPCQSHAVVRGDNYFFPRSSNTGRLPFFFHTREVVP